MRRGAAIAPELLEATFDAGDYAWRGSDAKRALPILQKAAAVATKYQMAPLDHADLDLTLARGLHRRKRDPARVKALAHSARDARRAMVAQLGGVNVDAQRAAAASAFLDGIR